MKKIEALISPEYISHVRDVLESRHIATFMFSNVIAKSADGVHQHVYRGHAHTVEVDSEVKLEAVVQDEEANDAAYAILKAAGSNRVCKPRIFLAPVNQVILPLDDIDAEPDLPLIGLKQPVEASLAACRHSVNPVEYPPTGRPALSTIRKIWHFLAAHFPEDRANESPSVASPSAVDRRWRRAWLSFPWPAAR